MAILGYFVAKTRTGRGMQATAQDPDTAKLMGINTDRIIVVAFALGAAFAAIGAVAYGLKYGEVQFRMGFLLGLKAFTAAVLGGIGNIYGAMIGGLTLGVAETMAAAYISRSPRPRTTRRPVLGQRLGLRTPHPRAPLPAPRHPGRARRGQGVTTMTTTQNTTTATTPAQATPPPPPPHPPPTAARPTAVTGGALTVVSAFLAWTWTAAFPGDLTVYGYPGGLQWLVLVSGALLTLFSLSSYGIKGLTWLTRRAPTQRCGSPPTPGSPPPGSR